MINSALENIILKSFPNVITDVLNPNILSNRFAPLPVNHWIRNNYSGHVLYASYVPDTPVNAFQELPSFNPKLTV